MDKQSSVNETIRGVWCIHCGLNSFSKAGKTPDGRQRIMCKYCKVKTTIGAKRKGERTFDESKLIPILRKNPLSLTPAERYAMGLIIADGCFTQGHTFSFTSKDEDLVQLLHNILKTPKTYRTYDRRHEGKGIEHMLRWRYKYSKEYWAQLGLKANKTGNEEWLSYMKDSHFIRGFFDGDGSIVSSDKRLSFTSASREYLVDLSKYLNYIVGVKIQKPYLIHASRTAAWGIRYRRKELLIICSYMYEDSDNLRLERKYNKYLEIKNG